MNLIAMYRQMHAEGKFAGLSVVPYASTIRELIAKTGSTSVLDFGCGKGQQYTFHNISEDWGVDLRLYDPAVPGFTAHPFPADGVICCDVMEHIPEIDVPKTLRKILTLAGKFVFFVICTRASKKSLPDGRNCHLTIQPKEWWNDAVENERSRLGKPLSITIIARDGL